MKALMKEAARHRPCDVQYVQYYTVFPDRSWNYYLRATYELRARDSDARRSILLIFSSVGRAKQCMRACAPCVGRSSR